jgi:phosphatidylglycerol---prolipoprotein diacylglyceryl transferase
MFVYPHPDPVALSLGPLCRPLVRADVPGGLPRGLVARAPPRRAAGLDLDAAEVDDLIFYCALGVILGGRVGWMLFYGTERILAEPLSICASGKAACRFTAGCRRAGGARGVRQPPRQAPRRRVRFHAPLPAIGFGAGRIGNFINGELWGKPTDVPWAVIVDGVPLHASSSTRRSSKGSCCS